MPRKARSSGAHRGHAAERPPRDWVHRKSALVLTALHVARRVFWGTFHDGFIHAGNLAYMAMVAIFPSFILGAAIFSAIGEEGERFATVRTILFALPPVVAEVIRPVAHDVIEQRSGWLLWAGGLFGLWAVGSLVETIRDILRRAYGTPASRAFWKHRLISTAIIIGAMVLLMLSLFAHVALVTAEEIISARLTRFEGWLDTLSYSRMVSAAGLYLALYLLFFSLTPAPYRQRRFPKWPGALLVTAWWIGVTIMLPPLLRSMFSYSLVYGSLAGIMISLFFFWLVGLGMVVGAELNAALAKTGEGEAAPAADNSD